MVQFRRPSSVSIYGSIRYDRCKRRCTAHNDSSLSCSSKCSSDFERRLLRSCRRIALRIPHGCKNMPRFCERGQNRKERRQFSHGYLQPSKSYVSPRICISIFCRYCFHPNIFMLHIWSHCHPSSALSRHFIWMQKQPKAFGSCTLNFNEYSRI